MIPDYTVLFDLKNKVALITGAAGSIGQEVALAMAQNGVHLALCDLNAAKLAEQKEQLQSYGVEVEAFRCDLRRSEEIDETVRAALEKFGRIDILFNHAGLNIRKPALEYTEEDWSALFDVNARGAFFMARLVGRQMILHKKGKIINTASVSAVRGHPNLALYAMTKGGIYQMTRVLGVEWARYNVNVNAIGPGYIYTGQTKNYLEDKQVHDDILNRIPLGRIGRPADLVGTVLFLASPASDYITGQLILVDGGRTID